MNILIDLAFLSADTAAACCFAWLTISKLQDINYGIKKLTGDASHGSCGCDRVPGVVFIGVPTEPTPDADERETSEEDRDSGGEGEEDLELKGKDKRKSKPANL